MHDKAAKYGLLIKQVEAMAVFETDPVATMANVAALLKDTFGWWWVGFYRVAGDELVLGPFQGPVACTRIKKGRGVCGTAWQKNRTIVVPDVHEFPGHIACSSASKSEIVVPITAADGTVLAVLDVDSEHPDFFDQYDALYLEQVAAIVAKNL